MLQATESLIPIMLLIGLGALLFKSRWISFEARRGMDWFTYWVALPSLFIHSLSGTDFGDIAAGGLLAVLALTIVAAAALAAIVAVVLGLKSEHSGVFVQIGFRGNMAFVGLPLIIFAMGEPGAGTDGPVVATALVALAAMVPLNNLLAVIALLSPQSAFTLKMIGKLGLKVITNPLIISAIVGGLLGLMGWRLPLIIDRPFELLGQTALALALVSLGGALIELETKGRIGLSVIASVFKVGVMPLIAFGLSVAWGLPPEQTFVVMIFSACPAATASYIMTTQLGGDDALAAAGIVVSTLISFVSLAVVLVLF